MYFVIEHINVFFICNSLTSRFCITTFSIMYWEFIKWHYISKLMRFREVMIAASYDTNFFLVFLFVWFFFVVLLILTLSLWHRCGKILFLLMKIFMGNSDFLGNFPRGSTYHPCFLNFYQFYHLNTVTKRYLMPIPPAFQVSLLSLIYQKTG
jgi:hypothetical protein